MGSLLGECICIPVIRSFKNGPNFLNACLEDPSLNFLASVFAKECLKSQIRLSILILFAAKE